MIVKFRCGNEETENRYWVEEDFRKCRMCKRRRLALEHFMNECVNLREYKKVRENLCMKKN